ncbi:MAG TPA: hypothetical protein QF764_11870 [Planctomycetota bacterium]|nr:hypothetical protein [Planctomycetota bacterium]
MNFFCRLFGHTWVHTTEPSKIRWQTNEKNLSELRASAPDGEPEFYRSCVRCGEHRAWAAPQHPDGSPTQATSGGL